jgi:hypothetical protein
MAHAGFCSIAFADALRLEISLAWGVERNLLTDRVLKEHPLPALAADRCTDPAFVRWAAGRQIDLLQPRSPRWVMQHWGTSFRRAQNPAYWTRVVEALVHRRLDAGQRCIVISDVRMHDEAQLVRRLGGVLLRVHHRGHVPMHPDAQCHGTEAQWWWIHVDGSVRGEAAYADIDQEIQRARNRLFPTMRPAEAAASRAVTHEQ